MALPAIRSPERGPHLCQNAPVGTATRPPTIRRGRLVDVPAFVPSD